MTARARAAELLDISAGDRASRWVDILLVGLISANVVAIILESVPAVAAEHGLALQALENISVALFTVEYVLRVWSAPDLTDLRFRDPVTGRLRYAFTPAALIDLLAIAPFYIGMLVNVDLRLLRVVRLFRIFKLTRYSSTMGLILNVFRDEAGAFVGAFFLLSVLLILTASGIYLIENDVQPESFGSIPAAMWWSMATLTTVGYGDVTPITPAGRLFGGCITVIGIGMVALPAGILASGFSEQLRQRRNRYNEQLEQAMEDGVVTNDEAAALESLRAELGISHEDATVLLNTALRRLRGESIECPHCHVSIAAATAVHHTNTKPVKTH